MPGLWLAKRLRVPHLYDMHSSLPQQLGNFGYTRSGLVRRLFERIETTMTARSRVVITICRELQDTAVALGAGDRAFLIENVMGGDVEGGGSVPPAELRARYGLRPDQPVVLYTGTFEPCQGLDLLFDVARPCSAAPIPAPASSSSAARGIRSRTRGGGR